MAEIVIDEKSVSQDLRSLPWGLSFQIVLFCERLFSHCRHAFFFPGPVYSSLSPSFLFAPPPFNCTLATHGEMGKVWLHQLIFFILLSPTKRLIGGEIEQLAKIKFENLTEFISPVLWLASVSCPRWKGVEILVS